MTKKRTSLDSILPGKREFKTPVANAVPATTEEPKPQSRRPNVKQPALYLKIPVYRQLRLLAFEEERKMHDLFLEAIDMLFAERGLPSIGELESGESEKPSRTPDLEPGRKSRR